MNKRQRNKLSKPFWEKHLKKLGGKKSDQYAMALCDYPSILSNECKKGEYYRIREKFPNPVLNDFARLQDKATIKEQKNSDNLFAGGGCPMSKDEFKIVWSNGGIVK